MPPSVEFAPAPNVMQSGPLPWLQLSLLEYAGAVSAYEYTVASFVARSVTVMLLRVRGATIADECTWAPEAAVPEAGEPWGPNEPTAPAVAAVLSASAAATVNRVAANPVARRTLLPSARAVAPWTVLISVPLLCPVGRCRSPLRKPIARLRISQPRSPAPSSRRV